MHELQDPTPALLAALQAGYTAAELHELVDVAVASMSQPGPSPSPAPSELPRLQTEQYEVGQIEPEARGNRRGISMGASQGDGFLPEADVPQQHPAAAVTVHTEAYGASPAATTPTFAEAIIASKQQPNGGSNLGQPHILDNLAAPPGPSEPDKHLQRDSSLGEEPVTAGTNMTEPSVEQVHSGAAQDLVRNSATAGADELHHTGAKQQHPSNLTEQLHPLEQGKLHPYKREMRLHSQTGSSLQI